MRFLKFCIVCALTVFRVSYPLSLPFLQRRLIMQMFARRTRLCKANMCFATAIKLLMKKQWKRLLLFKQNSQRIRRGRTILSVSLKGRYNRSLFSAAKATVKLRNVPKRCKRLFLAQQYIHVCQFHKHFRNRHIYFCKNLEMDAGRPRLQD